MKLNGPAAAKVFARPDPAMPAVLIFGADAMRVAMKRQEILAAILGPKGEEEMRLTRLPAADLRKDSAALLDAVKAISFFPGARAVFVEDATDGLTEVVAIALQDWREGDAQIVVTAGELKASSKLRKLFEGHRTAAAAALYDDPPTRETILAELSRAKMAEPPPDAMADLMALGRELSPGDFRQTMEKLALYKLGDATPLSPADIEAVAPATVDMDIDEALHVVAERNVAALGILLRRLEAQGVAPVTLVIMLARHFRALHAGACDPGGPMAGFQRMRPPVFGPRRDRMIRQAKEWGPAALEGALTQILETDLSLRSAGQTAPAMALVERLMIRLAMTRR